MGTKSSIEQKQFGKMQDGTPVTLYTLHNQKGMTLTVTTLGGRMVNLFVPDKHGHADDIIMGFDTIDSYLIRNPYFGALVGRCANRIKNASFSLNGRNYPLDINAAPHHLHGGGGGFDKRVWDAEVVTVEGQEKLSLKLTSADGDQGYPGNLCVTVLYGLSDEGELSLEYMARGDQDTVVNLTNHCYFNLAGHGSGTVLDHIIHIEADAYTDTDEKNMPTGKVVFVADTPLDFREAVRIGDRIHDAFPCLKRADGYDVNYVLSRHSEHGLEKFCTVYEPVSGRVMEGFTTLPGVQFYTANNIKGNFTFVGKEGVRYPQYCGFCLETQYFPDSPNHPEFPSVVLCKGEEYREKTVFRFGT